MLIAETPRLRLRRFTLDDAAAVLRLLNEPSWIQFIGDRGARSVEDARAYLSNGPLRSYEKNGFGLYAVDHRESGELIGMCGLIRREGLDGVDIGFAFFPRWWGSGYAYEAAAATMEHAREGLGLDRVLAITLPENERSIRLLERLGMRRERVVRMPNDTEDTVLYAWGAAGRAGS